MLYLEGIQGYLNGPTILNELCSTLYSNTNLKITARSMTIEDLNFAVGYTSSDFAGLKNNNYNGAYGDQKTYTSGTFYTYQSNGNTVTSTTPKTASSSAPITVKQTYYSYNTQNKNSTVAAILEQSSGKSWSWLASQNVEFNKQGLAVHQLFGVDAISFCHNELYCANGVAGDEFGRYYFPVISVNINRLHANGSAWDISADVTPPTIAGHSDKQYTKEVGSGKTVRVKLTGVKDDISGVSHVSWYIYEPGVKDPKIINSSNKIDSETYYCDVEITKEGEYKINGIRYVLRR